MCEYPELLPNACLPSLKDEDILSYCLVRETVIDIYKYREKEYELDDLIKAIIMPQKTVREVYDFSLYLFGYYSERHTGLRDTMKSAEKWFQLFLRADALCKKHIDFNGEIYLLSFSHSPNEDNFWHYLLWTMDKKTGEKIPKDVKQKKAHYRLLAEHIFGQFITKAICNRAEVTPFSRSDFDELLRC
jgi:hypothetical protein